MGMSRAASIFFWSYSLLSCLLIICLIVLTMRTKPVSNQPPNIIFIMADDLGWNDVSFHGSKQIPTPNIDALAYDGIILNNYYTLHTCTPSRAAFLTGRYPIYTGMQEPIFSAMPYGMSLDEKLLPEFLRELGYANHIVGKWHLGFFMKEYTPTLRGFDSHYGFYQGHGDYYNHTAWEEYPDPNTIGFDFHKNLALDQSVAEKYSTELFTTQAEHLIANHDKSQPLFLYMSHQAVHSSGYTDNPLQAPQRYLDKFTHIKDKNRRKYAAMVSVLDESVGNMTKAVANAGLLDNTIIIFTTDNGGAVDGYDDNIASNWPLRGCKARFWEGGTRGVGYIWSPLLEKSGYTSNHLMHITDWLPTVLSIAGYNMDKAQMSHLDGVDMWHTLSGNQHSSPRTDILYSIGTDTAALRVQNLKLVIGDQGPYSGWYPPWNFTLSHTKTTRLNSVSHINPLNMEPATPAMFKSELPSLFENVLGRTQRIRPDLVIIECGVLPLNTSIYENCNPANAPCLYDLDRDPCEFDNLAASMPKEVEDLLRILNTYNSTALPSRAEPVDPRGYPVSHDGNWEPWVKFYG